MYLEDVKKISTLTTINYDFLKNKKILVIGGTGMIGTFLIDVLIYRNLSFNDNISITVMCRDAKRAMEKFNYYDKINYIEQDICKKFDFDSDFDFIVNCASNTHPRQYATDPVGTITTNVIGTNNILEYCKNRNNTKILMMSSVEIYGENKGDIDLFTEDYLGYIDCNTSRAGYPESKRLCESLCKSYIKQYGENIVIGRFSRVFGSTMKKDDSKALSQFLRNAANNEPIILKSSGTQLFSYTYVADAVQAILLLLEKGQTGEAYNIANMQYNIQLKDLAQKIANTNNSTVSFELPDETEKRGYSTATKAIMDSTKIESLGYKPIHSLDIALLRTISILREANRHQ